MKKFGRPIKKEKYSVSKHIKISMIKETKSYSSVLKKNTSKVGQLAIVICYI